MTEHENQNRIQAGWDALAKGDPRPAFEMMADDIVVENGPAPGAQRWIRLLGKAAFETMMMGLNAFFGGTLRQDGTCVYADDKHAVSVVHEIGRVANGDVYETNPMFLMRFNGEGLVDRLWIVEPDEEFVMDFFARHPLSAPR